ncbi:MAG: hypothetical protein ACLR7U_05925 [Ruthenibacterium lactatiformans]
MPHGYAEAARGKSSGGDDGYDQPTVRFCGIARSGERSAAGRAPLADIVKVPEEEMELLTGEVHWRRSGRAGVPGAALVLVTLGPRGAYYRAGRAAGCCLPEVDTWTLRARATLFWERCCRALRARRWRAAILPQAQWERIVAFANRGPLTTAARGPSGHARAGAILRLCGE